MNSLVGNIIEGPILVSPVPPVPLINTDVLFASPNNYQVPSTLAVKTYVNSLVPTDLSAFTGSTVITTLGTVSTGAWNGTPIADSYIASAATWNAKQNSITTGTTAQYLRGDLSLATLNAGAVAGLGTAATHASGDFQPMDGTLTALSGVGWSGIGSVARAISPAFTTPSLGAATATSINGIVLASAAGHASADFATAAQGAEADAYAAWYNGGDVLLNSISCPAGLLVDDAGNYYAMTGNPFVDAIGNINWTGQSGSPLAGIDGNLRAFNGNVICDEFGNFSSTVGVANLTGTAYSLAVGSANQIDAASDFNTFFSPIGVNASGSSRQVLMTDGAADGLILSATQSGASSLLTAVNDTTGSIIGSATYARLGASTGGLLAVNQAGYVFDDSGNPLGAQFADNATASATFDSFFAYAGQSSSGSSNVFLQTNGSGDALDLSANTSFASGMGVGLAGNALALFDNSTSSEALSRTGSVWNGDLDGLGAALSSYLTGYVPSLNCGIADYAGQTNTSFSTFFASGPGSLAGDSLNLAGGAIVLDPATTFTCTFGNSIDVQGDGWQFIHATGGGATPGLALAAGFAAWGASIPVTQPATPVLLTDVIALLQTYGLCA